MKDSFSKIGFVSLTFFASLFCVGTFHEYISCICSVFFACWIFLNHVKQKKTVIYGNLPSLSIGLIVLFYGLTIFWAVDPGMAFIGFLKYLPLLLFAIILMQTDENEVIVTFLPYTVCIMAVLSALLGQIPILEDYFIVSGRLGGFLQYPNTFAVVILISEILLLTKKKIKLYDIISISLLIAALIYTGCRTVVGIAIAANIAAILVSRSKRFIFNSSFAVTAGGFIAVVFCIATDNDHIIENLLKISIKESAFTGRILYALDALPAIMKHPLGLGYMGYSYMQPSIQTGVYSTPWVHNDLLQLMLDVGWIPALLFFFAVIKKIFGKKTKKADRIILSCLILHSFLDFDMQFISVFFLYMLYLDLKEGKAWTVENNNMPIGILAGLAACISIYMGTSLILYNSGNYAASYAMYPFNTENASELILYTDSPESADKIASKINKQNKYALIPYNVKADIAYNENNFSELIKYKNRIFELTPFNYEEYEDYARLLINGVSLYKQTGDKKGEEECLKELRDIPKKLEALNERLSTVGRLTKTQPQTRLPDSLIKMIDSID